MKKGSRGFSLIELIVALGLLSILMAIAIFSYKRYEARYRCHAAGTVLAQDIRFQQARARALDGPQGIYFTTKYFYSLGSGDSIASYQPNRPQRDVDLTQQYQGIYVQRIHDDIANTDNSPAYFISFSPQATDSSGIWTPLSGFQGYIVLNGGNAEVNVKIAANKEVTVEIR
jgi:prepilin-type N-terminal cleavage/methylation domain-containing protein